jgi:HAMP domain-containing protein
LRPERSSISGFPQSSARHPQIAQSKRRCDLGDVLHQSAIPGLCVAKLALEDAERVFDLGTDVDRQGATLAHTLSTTGNPPAPVVREMAERRKNGDILLVSRGVTKIFRIRKAIINAFALGDAFCLAAGIAVGLAMSVRQMRSVRAIRRVTLRIAQGDLNQRLPTDGHDEIDMLSHLVNRMLDEVERWAR